MSPVVEIVRDDNVSFASWHLPSLCYSKSNLVINCFPFRIYIYFIFLIDLEIKRFSLSYFLKDTFLLFFYCSLVILLVLIYCCVFLSLIIGGGNEKSASGEKMQQRDTATIFHGCSICQTDSMIRQRICRGSDSDCTDAWNRKRVMELCVRD